MTQLPQEPAGDEQLLSASISRLQALLAEVEIVKGAPRNQYDAQDWKLGKLGTKVESKLDRAEELGDQAARAIRETIADLQHEAVRVAKAKATWRFQCAAILAAGDS
jgi:hypothetical protein